MKVELEEAFPFRISKLVAVTIPLVGGREMWRPRAIKTPRRDVAAEGDVTII